MRQLAYKIKEAGTSPRFAFFLGAGASFQSGIPVASGMIRDFKKSIIERECPEDLQTDQEKDQWLAAQPWYNPDDEYSCLFERIEPKEVGRQRYIEMMIDGRAPSFGYVVLANLLATNHINTIMTTNFDDLIYDASSKYTDIRPIVYAYGIMASEMRILSLRPKILKLHGDYLYSALKNTDTELAEQDLNMAKGVSQFLKEYGLVVVGYGGNDKSIMELLRGINERNDFYWCVRRGEIPNTSVQELLQERRGEIIEIDGFDEMMNEIRGIVGFDVRAMVGGMQKREQVIIEQLKAFAPKNKSTDILVKVADVLAEQADQQLSQNKEGQALRYFAQGLEAAEAGKFQDAEHAYRRAIELDPRDYGSYNNLGILLYEKLQRYPDAEAAFRKAIELNPHDATVYYNLGSLLHKGLQSYSDAEVAYRQAIELDPQYAAAYSALGNLFHDMQRYPDAEAAYRNAIERDPYSADLYCDLGSLFHDMQRYPDAEAAFRQAIELNPQHARTYNNLGFLLTKNPSRIANSEAMYRKALELDPNDATTYYNLGYLFANDSNRIADAEANYRKAIELNPQYAYAYYGLAGVLAKNPRRYSDAEAMYRKAIELIPNYADTYISLAALLSRDPNRTADFEAAYKKALELDPQILHRT
ncbi:MAG: tetratricopeptide repeat protein [Chloroflexi bacterium]|nr:tetratricopeptide repeat protein [Chloroflexota bacterium]